MAFSQVQYMKVTTRIRQKLTKSAIVQDNEMIYLYKAIHGSVAHSEANSVAKKAGIDEKLLERSSDILKCIAQGGELTTNLHLTCDFQAQYIY